MGTATDAKRCGNRGPRVGGAGVPVCGLRRGHAGNHAPPREDGWDRSIQWANIRSAAETPADVCRWLLTLDDPEDVIGREERRTVTMTQIIDRARRALVDTDQT